MDCYSPEGAKKLARAIERKWKGRVKVWIEVREDMEGSPRLVRTNLVNGLPPATYQAHDFGYLP